MLDEDENGTGLTVQVVDILPDVLNSSDTNSISIDAVINDFLNQYTSKQTKSAYKRNILRFFNRVQVTDTYQLWQMPYHQIKKELVNYINSYKKFEENQPDRILNPRTVNQVAFSLSAFFEHLIDNGYTKNPLKNWKSEPVTHQSNTISFTSFEIHKILDYLKKEYEHKPCYQNCRNYLAILFLYGCACRVSEVCNLRWKDIKNDVSTGQVYIEVLQKGRSTKKLPLPDKLIKLLDECKSFIEVKNKFIITPVMNNATKDLDKPLNPSNLFRIVKKIVAEVVPDKADSACHSYRKSFIEHSLNAGIGYIDIINSTGHSKSSGASMVAYYDSRSVLEKNAIHIISKSL